MKNKPGDVFSVGLGENLGFFQFIMLDQSQLNSEVIRVFGNRHSKLTPSLSAIPNVPVEFYAHVDISLGIRKGLWDRVGNVSLERPIEKPFFGMSEDYGDPDVRISCRWYVWRCGEEYISVGELSEEEKKFDIGPVIAPGEIVERMRSGKYSYFYPDF